ncbi:hypothetical protein E2320_003159, partial [Naja naja]
MEELDVDH